MLSKKLKSYYLQPRNGFTLIELLIAIAIVGIIAVVAFVALDPGKRLKDSRNAKRWTDVSAIVDAIKVAQVDDGGTYRAGLAAAPADSTRMITTVVQALGCAPEATKATVDAGCDVAVAVDACVSLAEYIGPYLSVLPEAPTSADTARVNWGASTNETGYYLIRNTNGTITVGACDGEPESPTPGVNEIKITR